MIGDIGPILEQFDTEEQACVEMLPTDYSWVKKAKYEEREVVIDLRELDDDGTLDIAQKLDKTTNKYLPIVKMVSGCLIVTLRREK